MQRYDWTGSELQLRVMGADGALLSERNIQFNDQCRIQMLSSPNGAEVSAEYDINGGLASLNSADASIIRHTENQLFSRDGTLISYDDAGKATSILMTPHFCHMVVINQPG